MGNAIPYAHRTLRAAAGLLLVCLLAGCARGQISHDTAFDTQSQGGLVVIGLTTEADAQRKPPSLFWTAYDPVTGTLGMDYKVVGDRSDDALSQINPMGMIYKDPGGHRFLVFTLPAGNWLVERIFAVVQAPMYKPYTVGYVLSEGTIAIAVEDGEAIYAGELIYDPVPTIRPGNLSAAKTYLAENFPGVRTPLVDGSTGYTTFACARQGESNTTGYCGPKAPRPVP